MTFAQFIGDGTSGVVGVINAVVIPFIFGLAFLVFIWGVVKYFFLSMDNDTERTKGKKFMLWGIIGFVVLFSVWGLVGLLLSTLGIAPTK